ncbi:MAG TPA: ATP-binding protein [Nitrospira sp.]|nr:ATP-binding protein [Nitrospira sp.]
MITPSRPHTYDWRLLSIVGLLTLVALAFVPLTLTVLQSRDSDALLIDMAGRQRMLLERYMKEVLQASQGLPAEYHRTGALLHERWDALIQGGLTNVDGQIVSLPAAPTEPIRKSLLAQQRELDAFKLKIEALIHGRLPDHERENLREEVINDNAVLLEQAHEVVSLLYEHSKSRIQRLIRGEAAAVLLIVAVASLGTWRSFKAEKELKQSQAMTMEALRQADAMKSALLSSVSHELRTPLTAIRSTVFSLLDDGHTESSRREFLGNIEEQVGYLDRLVGNLLDMSKVEAGALQPNRQWHVLEELLEAAVRRVDVLLKERVLQIELARNLPPVYVDGVQIQQVLVNLLENAAKFSPPHTSIILEASMSNGTLKVRVSNTGEGISPEHLPRVFDRFFRGAAGRAGGPPGTGLGLAICKAIIEAHGGEITVQSSPGNETAFLFCIPGPACPPDAESSLMPIEAKKETA